MKKTETEVTVMEVKRGRIEFLVCGTSPMICNAMSNKVRQELLFPAAKKNAAAKASTLKHEPISEFRDSMYYARDPKSPTKIVMKATAFKAAMMSAALDLPGATKAQVGRLVYVEGDEIPIYGVPELMMAITRSANINRTPDVRTRAILPSWAAKVTVIFTAPILKEQTIINMLAAAGMMSGIGDWRIQKGSGNYGGFALVDSDDPLFLSVIDSGGKKAQVEAIKDPVCFDSETEELLDWYDAEVKRRGFKSVS